MFVEEIDWDNDFFSFRERYKAFVFQSLAFNLHRRPLFIWDVCIGDQAKKELLKLNSNSKKLAPFDAWRESMKTVYHKRSYCILDVLQHVLQDVIRCTLDIETCWSLVKTCWCHLDVIWWYHMLLSQGTTFEVFLWWFCSPRTLSLYTPNLGKEGSHFASCYKLLSWL